MILYIQKEKILKNIHALNDLNKQTDKVFDLFRLKEEVFNLEKIAEDVVAAEL